MQNLDETNEISQSWNVHKDSALLHNTYMFEEENKKEILPFGKGEDREVYFSYAQLYNNMGR